MKIKSFQLFENETSIKSKSFTNTQFNEFCDEVSKWSDEHESPVHWCLYGHPKASSEGGYNKAWTKEGAKKYWDMYVKSGKTFTLVEMDKSLVGVLHTGDNIEMAFDEMDNKVDQSKLKDLI